MLNCTQFIHKPWQIILAICFAFTPLQQSCAQTLSGEILPVLIPVDEYGDFISYGRDALRHDSGKKFNTGFTRLFAVDAVAARGNDIFVADIGQRSIFHIDRAQRSISKFASLDGGLSTDLFFAVDFSLYVIDQRQRQVIQYARDGRVVAKYENSIDLSSPVAVVESEEMNRVLIADGLAGKIAMFNRLGSMFGIIGQNINIQHPAGNITDMVTENGFIYLLDKVAREVSVIDTEGRPLYSVGASILKQPVAIALDYCRRIFVADQFDNSIQVFNDDEHLTTFENMRGRYRIEQLSDIWIADELLYVADGVSGSIKILRIEGECS